MFTGNTLLLQLTTRRIFQLILQLHFTIIHTLTQPIKSRIPSPIFIYQAQTFPQPSITPYHCLLLLLLPTGDCHCLLPHALCLTTYAFYCPLLTSDLRLTTYDFFPTLTPFLVIRTSCPVPYNSHYLLIKHLVLCQKLVTTS